VKLLGRRLHGLSKCQSPEPAKPVLPAQNMTTTTDILVIEDDSIMRDALAEWLEAAGYAVRKAADGSAGLAAVRSAAPALVVTDIHMPGTSGAVVIAELKQHHPQIPVIAISGLFNSGHGMDADAAIALGAARALAKPFKRGELLMTVSDLLRTTGG
jgi:CheY-like chemotaxis protein